MTDEPDKSFDDDSDMHSEIIVEFVLLDFSCSHDDITNALGAQPSYTWFKGDHVGRKQQYLHRHKNTGWLLESGLPRDTSLPEQVRAVLDRIHPRHKELRACGPCYAYLNGVVYSYNGDRPDLGLKPAEVSKLADLNAGFRIDLYVL
jgi:hypothetical protein